LSSVYAARDLFKKSLKQPLPVNPAVSVLKPIRGLDSFAYENLSSFCRQNYPKYQVIYGALDPDDRGLEPVRRIRAEFDQVDIRVVACPDVIGTNLKVSNLANMEREADYPILVLADSDIRVDPDYLERIVRPFADPRVGVVTCLYRARPRGVSSSLEALGTSTDFHAGVLVARKLQGVKFALGSTVAIRREVLDRIGGFKAISDYLADDFLLGSLAADAGYTVVLSDYVVEHVVDAGSLIGFIKHQTRWGRSTRASRPRGYAGLVFTHGVAASLLLLFACGGSAFGWIVLGATWGIRTLAGFMLGAVYLKDRNVARVFWLIPLRDLIGFALWVYTFVGDTVEWRGKRFKLTKGGKLIPLSVEGET
ncbi:MAG TPA: bacteriohopanetetrol glucosamine biosynthesis glycosyltransferase HpnI, partial [Blastocatellia bacterium]